MIGAEVERPVDDTVWQEDGSPVAWRGYPWEREPYRLWSLIDLQRFYASNFAIVLTRLEAARILLGIIRDDPPPADRQRPRGLLQEVLDELHRELSLLGLSPALLRQVEHLRARVESSPAEVLSSMASGLRDGIQAEA